MKNNNILVVDLDGTLVKTDMLFETFWSVLSSDIKAAFKAIKYIWFLTRMYAWSGVKEDHPDSGRDSGCSSLRYGTRTLCG